MLTSNTQISSIDNIKNIPIWLIHGIDDTDNTILSDEQFFIEKNKKDV